jgi:hypothetical protein
MQETKKLFEEINTRNNEIIGDIIKTATKLSGNKAPELERFGIRDAKLLTRKLKTLEGKLFDLCNSYGFLEYIQTNNTENKNS